MSESHGRIFLRGSLISLVGVGLVGILNYLVRRYLSIYLPEADYGMFYSTLALLFVIFGFGDLGISQSGTALIAKYAGHPRQNGFFGAVLLFKTGIAVICLTGVFLFSPVLSSRYLHTEMLYPILFLAGMIAIQTIEGSLRALWNGLKLFGRLQFFQLSGAALLFFGVITVVPYAGLRGAVMVFLLVPALLLIVQISYGLYARKIHFPFHVSAIEWKKLFQTSKWVAVSTTMLATVYNMDTVMLTIMKGVESSATYNIALPIMQIIQSLMIFPAVFLPIAIEMGQKRNYRELRRITRFTGLITIIVAPCVYIVFRLIAKWLIVLLFSAKYTEAAPAVPLLCTGLIFFTAGNFLFQILLSMGKTAVMAAIACTVTGCNVLFNWLLIARFDFVGAAWATMIGYLLFAVLSGIVLEFCFRCRQDI